MATEGTDTNATPTTSTTDTTPANSGAATGSQTPATQQTDTDKLTLTQAELDKLIGQRAQRAKEAAVKELLEKLGVEDPDKLEALVGAEKKRQEAEMSEVEKANKALEKQQTEAQQLRMQLEALQAQRNQDRLRFAITNAAHTAQAHKAEAVITLLESTQGDALKAALNDSGEVDSKQIETLIGKLKESDPYLFELTPQRRTPGSQSSGGGSAPRPDKDAEKRARTTNQRIIRG